MAELYDFGWIHQEAKRLRFGKLALELSVKDGAIMRVEIVEVKRSRSLEDVRKNKARLVDPLYVR